MMNPAARKLVKAESKETVECSSEPGGEGQLWHLAVEGLHPPRARHCHIRWHLLTRN